MSNPNRGGGGGSNEDSSTADEKLAQFIAFTGTAEDVAKHWLEANANSLEGAVNMFMESNSGGGAVGANMGNSGTGRGGSSAGGEAAGSSWPGGGDMSGGAGGAGGAGFDQQRENPNDPDYVRPADPYKRQRLVDDSRHHAGYGGVSTTRPWRNPAVGANPFRDFAEESRRASHSMALKEGIVSSDPAVAEKQRKLASIFAPPSEIMFMGDFQEARQAAKLQKKWLLVNIQADGEFDCHRLNRDVWKDEMVQNIIACNCIFWQQPSVSEEAKTYCRRYDATMFPHIALIDPRTGFKVWYFQGFLSPPDFVEKITDVTDKISFEEGAPARLPPPPPRPPQLPPNTSGSEDQMLAAAIAASLESANGATKSSDDNGYTIGSNTNQQQRQPDDNTQDTSSSSSSASSSLSSFSTLTSMNGRGDRTTADSGGSATSPANVMDNEDEDDDEVVVVGEAGAAAGELEGLRKGKGKRRARILENDRSGGGAGGDGGVTPSGRGGGVVVADAGVQTPRATVDGDRRDARNGVSSGGAAGKSAAATEGSESRSAGVQGSAAEAAAVAVAQAEVLEEPPEDTSPDKTSIRFQFPSGQRVVRKFRKGSSVRQLFLFAESELEGANTKTFDVRTIRPPTSIRGMEDRSIEQAGLSNSAVVVAWED